MRKNPIKIILINLTSITIIFFILFFYKQIKILLYKEIQTHVRTITFNSDIPYRENTYIYKIVSRHSLLGEFDSIRSDYFPSEIFYNEVLNRYHILEVTTFDELNEMCNKYFYIDQFDEIFNNTIFDDHILGLIDVLFTGERFLKNALIYNYEEKLTFDIEVWTRTIPPGAGIPAAAWNALFVLAIPR